MKLAAVTLAAPNTVVTGRVLVCNMPGHCLTRVVRVAVSIARAASSRM